MNLKALFSPKALATLLGLAEQTIYNRHSAGGDLPPAIKLGRLLRFKADDVEAWLELQRQPAAPVLPIFSSNSRRPGRPTKAEQVERRRGQLN
ncbi:helix-turn-helix transcriptional regulator [Zoogloea sp.]|uniref:helix-turn-helix transcriptional regulator n=1 Tax=Zoogloea sp. TaxID=49181 RepID=UPI0035B0B8C7